MGTAAAFKKLVSPCWRPSVKTDGESSNSSGDVSGRVHGLWWYKDSGQHVNGEFSMALIQANKTLEDQSQLESGPMSSMESGPQGTFVGIYDGHGGAEAARFVNNNLFNYIKTIHGTEFTAEHQGMSGEVISKAFLATEDDFLSVVRNQWLGSPKIASVGACCLVGIICSGWLYIANAGDSRVVMGRLEKTAKEVKAVQLSAEHNANLECVRDELHKLHPNDPQIVVLKHKVWRVKGIIQVIPRLAFPISHLPLDIIQGRGSIIGDKYFLPLPKSGHKRCIFPITRRNVIYNKQFYVLVSTNTCTFCFYK